MKISMRIVGLLLIVIILIGSNSSIKAENQSLEDGGKATCYSTYSSGGNNTIHLCGTCNTVSNVNSYSDSGSCRP
jgi:hypothetical protein